MPQLLAALTIVIASVLCQVPGLRRRAAPLQPKQPTRRTAAPAPAPAAGDDASVAASGSGSGP
jgi:hypothetical protein